MIMIQAPVLKKKKKTTQEFLKKKRGLMVGGTALARTVAGLQRTKEQHNYLNIPPEIYALLVSSLLRNLSSKIKNILRFES